MNDGGLVVRSAEACDEEAVRRLLAELGYELAGRREDFRASFAELLGASPPRVWIAERRDGGAPIGMMSLSYARQLRLAGLAITIDELVVAGSARGRGVGRALLEHARAIAAELGAHRIELTTRRTRESYARAFYTRNGFVEVDSAVMRWER